MESSLLSAGVTGCPHHTWLHTYPSFGKRLMIAEVSKIRVRIHIVVFYLNSLVHFFSIKPLHS